MAELVRIFLVVTQVLEAKHSRLFVSLLHRCRRHPSRSLTLTHPPCWLLSLVSSLLHALIPVSNNTQLNLFCRLGKFLLSSLPRASSAVVSLLHCIAPCCYFPHQATKDPPHHTCLPPFRFSHPFALLSALLFSCRYNSLRILAILAVSIALKCLSCPRVLSRLTSSFSSTSIMRVQYLGLFATLAYGMIDILPGMVVPDCTESPQKCLAGQTCFQKKS